MTGIPHWKILEKEVYRVSWPEWPRLDGPGRIGGKRKLVIDIGPTEHHNINDREGILGVD
jgi:hypothetical protein